VGLALNKYCLVDLRGTAVKEQTWDSLMILSYLLDSLISPGVLEQPSPFLNIRSGPPHLGILRCFAHKKDPRHKVTGIALISPLIVDSISIHEETDRKARQWAPADGTRYPWPLLPKKTTNTAQ
jgi:hypothetical protein